MEQDNYNQGQPLLRGTKNADKQYSYLHYLNIAKCLTAGVL